MTIDINRLPEIYFEWATKNIQFKNTDNITVIETPFVDMYHDSIELYVEEVSNKYKISDDGYTMSELDTLGVSVKRSDKRRTFFEKTLRNFGVAYDEETLELFVIFNNLNQLPTIQFRLVQCLIQISDMLLTSREHVANLFIEDITNYFFDNDLTFDQNTGYTGKTGNTINFDFTFGRSKNSNAKAIKTVNRPKSTAYESPLMGIIDVRDSRENTDFFVLANDTEDISSEFINSFTNYEIPVLRWTQREEWINKFKRA